MGEVNQSAGLEIQTTIEQDQEKVAYFTGIRKHIQKHADEADSLAEWAGEWVKVRLTLLRDGTVGNVRVAESSGNKAFERRTLEIVDESVPFEPLPDFLDMEEMDVVVPFGLQVE